MMLYLYTALLRSMGNGKSVPPDTVHDIINLLSLFEGPDKERDSPGIHHKSTQPKQMRRDSCKFTPNHTNILGSFRDLNICNLLYCCTEGHVKIGRASCRERVER